MQSQDSKTQKLYKQGAKSLQRKLIRRKNYDKNKKFHFLFNKETIIALVTPILVCAGTWYTANENSKTQELIAKTNSDIENLKNQYARSSELSKYLKDLSESSDKDPVKNSLAFAGLYALAGDCQENKRIVITITASTQNKEVLKNLLALVKGDNQAQEIIQKNPELASLLAPPTESSNPIPNLSNLNYVDTLKTDILQIATAEDAEGWIFLGNLEPGSEKFSEDRLIDKEEIPETGKEVSIKSKTTLMDSKPNGTQKITGIIKENQEVKIKQLLIPTEKSNVKGVWAEVQVSN
jgi:hypothetical protein